LKKIESTSEKDQWRLELNEFKNEYIKWLDKYKLSNDKINIKTKLVSKVLKEDNNVKKKVIKKTNK